MYIGFVLGPRFAINHHGKEERACCFSLIVLLVCLWSNVSSSCYHWVICDINQESLAQIENQIKPRVYVRRIRRSTISEKVSFCKPELASGKLVL